MNVPVLDLVLVAVFILVGGVFAATEIALVSLRDAQAKALSEKGRRGARVVRLMGDPSRFLAAVQVGVTLAGFFSAAFGASTLSGPLAEFLVARGVGPGLADPLAFVLVTIMISYLSLVVGELTPKRLALQRAEGFSLIVAAPLNAIAKLFRPIIWLLSRSTDVLVRLLGGDPKAGGESISQEELRDLVSHWGAELELAPAETIIEWAAATFGDRFAITSSMGDALLAHVAAKVVPGIDVVFLDTGYHFPETIGTRDAVEAVTDVEVITLAPRQSVAEQDARYGAKLHDRDPDLCCALRKVQPLEEGLREYDAWATGLRREESPTRANTPVVGWDEKRQKVKVSPLARWSDEEVEKYIAENGVLVNPLQYDGYPSIGCWPCTQRVAPGDDPRSGRWAGTAKTECGINQ